MDKYRVFADFGSTFTKMVAFDMEKEELAARVQTPSTVETDIMEGLHTAFAEIQKQIPLTESEISGTKACSSAAGGLKMVCIGLVPDFTTEAGRLAALGAGAKVVGSFSFELTKSEIRQIEALQPDIVLLTGGTDGGNKKVIIHNAEMLAGSSVKHILVAGNKSAYDDIREAFEGSGRSVKYTSNVMPEFGKLELLEVNQEIRETFLSNIIKAKGIAGVSEEIAGVIMPTPAAVLEAAKLISVGAGDEHGLGELLLVDVGGATTDVFSIGAGRPTKVGVALNGLIEPVDKRTVEGDLGMYHNIDSLSALAEDSGDTCGLEPEEFEKKVEELKNLRSIPGSDDEALYQARLTSLAVRTAVDRHAGRIRSVMTRNGEVLVHNGKDLTPFKAVLGSGGPVCFSRFPLEVLKAASFENDRPDILKPKNPDYFLDEKYILFAIGLLSADEPEKAVRIAKKYLKKL